MADIQINQNQTSAAALIEFWNTYVIDKGKVNQNTARSLGAASKAILSIEEDWEQLDVTQIDYEDFIQRFETRQARNYSPKTLKVYARRFRRALEHYRSFLDNPSGWKFPSAAGTSKSKASGKRRARGSTRALASSPALPQAPAMTDSGIQLVTYQYPLRPDCMIQVRLPMDLTEADVDRFTVYLRSLILPVHSSLSEE